MDFCSKFANRKEEKMLNLNLNLILKIKNKINKKILILFVVLLSLKALGQSGPIVKNEFKTVHHTINSLIPDKVPPRHFEASYGLLSQSLYKINELYEAGVPEATTEFSNQTCFVSYLFFRAFSEFKKDRKNFGSAIEESRKAIVKIIKTRGWKLVTLKPKSQNLQYTEGEELSQTVQCSSASLIGAMAPVIPGLLQNDLGQFHPPKFFDEIITIAHDISKMRVPDSSRTLGKKVKKLIDVYDAPNNRESFSEFYSKFRRAARTSDELSIIVFSKLKNFKEIVLALKEHKNYGIGFSRIEASQ